jgi:hypothetical protein
MDAYTKPPESSTPTRSGNGAAAALLKSLNGGTASAPAPAAVRRPVTNQISTVAKRNACDSAVLAARALGSRRGLDAEIVAGEIIDGVGELNGPALHALWLIFRALKRGAA